MQMKTACKRRLERGGWWLKKRSPENWGANCCSSGPHWASLMLAPALNRTQKCCLNVTFTVRQYWVDVLSHAQTMLDRPRPAARFYQQMPTKDYKFFEYTCTLVRENIGPRENCGENWRIACARATIRRRKWNWFEHVLRRWSIARQALQWTRDGGQWTRWCWRKKLSAQPQYLVDLCQYASSVASMQHLRSANRDLLVVPRYRLSSYGRRAFLWRSFTEDVFIFSLLAYIVHWSFLDDALYKFTYLLT